MESEAALVESLQHQHQQHQQQQSPSQAQAQSQSQSRSRQDSSPPANNNDSDNGNGNGNGVNGRNDAAAASKAANLAANQAHLSFRRLDHQIKSSRRSVAIARSLVLSKELC